MRSDCINDDLNKAIIVIESISPIDTLLNRSNSIPIVMIKNKILVERKRIISGDRNLNPTRPPIMVEKVKFIIREGVHTLDRWYSNCFTKVLFFMGLFLRGCTKFFISISFPMMMVSITHDDASFSMEDIPSIKVINQMIIGKP